MIETGKTSKSFKRVALQNLRVNFDDDQNQYVFHSVHSVVNDLLIKYQSFRCLPVHIYVFS